MEDFCPRCFWVAQHVHGKLPYQMPMPGIFISIDRYGKNLIHSHFDAQQRLPAWYPDIGVVSGYVPPESLHWSKFFADDGETNIHLRGEPDDMFRMRDRSFHIVDYKTAKATVRQDELLPLYRIQLNAYAYICAHGRRKFSPVSGLSLIYTEPQTDFRADTHPEVMRGEGFALHFAAKLERVELDPEGMIPPLLREARAIYDQQPAPRGKLGCEDCDNFARILNLLTE
jgi:hypothetical protein